MSIDYKGLGLWAAAALTIFGVAEVEGSVSPPLDKKPVIHQNPAHAPAQPVIQTQKKPDANHTGVLEKRAIFVLETGKLILPSGVVVDAASGNGKGRNNPLMANKEDVGPIPTGEWLASPVRWHKFELDNGSSDNTQSVELSPINDRQALNRDGLFMHHTHSSGLESHGCIVMKEADTRKVLAARKAGVFDRVLVVRRQPDIAVANQPPNRKSQQAAVQIARLAGG